MKAETAKPLSSALAKFRAINSKQLGIGLSLLIVSTVICFAVYRALAQDWIMVALDISIVITHLIALFYNYRHPESNIVGDMVSVLFILGACAAILTGDTFQAFWLYPAIMAAFYISSARLVAPLALIGIGIAVWRNYNELPTTALITMFMTLLTTNIFVAAFASITRKHQRDMTQQAFRDSLTKCGNRHALKPTIDDVIAGPHEHHPLLVIFDIDNFKFVNDKYGHAIGDQILVIATQVVQDYLNSPEDLFRYGGDEFVFILDGAEIEITKTLIEHIRRRISREIYPKDLAVTASFGATALKADDSMVSWLDRADQALLSAKRAGKNCVRISGQE